MRTQHMASNHMLVNCFLCFFLGLVLFLAIKGMIDDTSRFGWSMFSYSLSYHVDYSISREDGTFEALQSPRYSRKGGVFYYKLGDLSSQEYAFLRYTHGRHRPNDVIMANITYERNLDKSKSITLRYPR